MRSPFLALALLAVCACDTIKQPATMISDWSGDWRQVVTPADRARLRDWRAAFSDGLAAARKAWIALRALARSRRPA